MDSLKHGSAILQHFLEHFGVSVAAITGVLAARGKHVDLFGVIVLALVAAFGGGTLRDLLLSQRIFWIDGPDFVLNAFTTAVTTFFLVRYFELPATILMIADAFALALFTIAGARKGLAIEVYPALAIAMGVITGVAGGILRDLLIGEIPMVFRREIYLYATAAFCGASFFVLISHWSEKFELNAVLGLTTTLLMRLAGIRWRISLPIFRPKNIAASTDSKQPR